MEINYNNLEFEKCRYEGIINRVKNKIEERKIDLSQCYADIDNMEMQQQAIANTLAAYGMCSDNYTPTKDELFIFDWAPKSTKTTEAAVEKALNFLNDEIEKRIIDESYCLYDIDDYKKQLRECKKIYKEINSLLN